MNPENEAVIETVMAGEIHDTKMVTNILKKGFYFNDLKSAKKVKKMGQRNLEPKKS